MNPYSTDLRYRIVERCLAGGLTQRDVADLFTVSPRTVSNYVSRFRKTGSLEPKPHRGGPAPKLDAAAREQLRLRVEQTPDATLEQLCEQMGGVVSVPTLCKTLRSMGARRKKNSTRQ